MVDDDAMYAQLEIAEQGGQIIEAIEPAVRECVPEPLKGAIGEVVHRLPAQRKDTVPANPADEEGSIAAVKSIPGELIVLLGGAPKELKAESNVVRFLLKETLRLFAATACQLERLEGVNSLCLLG